MDCTRDQIQGSKPVTLQPNQTLDVKFVTPNCGSKDRPSFRPNVVRSSRIDQGAGCTWIQNWAAGPKA